MSLLKRLFGSTDPLTILRKHAGQGRWAEVLTLGEDLVGQQLDSDGRNEVERLIRQAGDRLATINLEEAEAFARAGDAERARDHLQLASAQVRDAALRERIEEAGRTLQFLSQRPAQEAAGCGSGCADHCGPEPVSAGEPDSAASLDLDTRLELSLGGYPDDLVERYRRSPVPFRQAVILAHQGEAEAALAAFSDPACGTEEDLIRYERGTLLAHMGRPREAAAELEKVLALAPAHPLAGDVLVNLLLGEHRLDEAQSILVRLGAAGFPPDRIQARQALLQLLQGRPDAALQHAQEAYRLGNREPEAVLLLGNLLERADRLDEAESLLAKLSGAGCGGSVPVPLAEFWLRHGRQLDKALEAFKAAWRHEPANPVWPLRTAQTYLAKGWQREGRKILGQVLAMDGLSEAVAREARQTLDAL